MLNRKEKLPEALPGLVREELNTECLVFNPETLLAVCLSSEGCLVLNMCQRHWTHSRALAELADLGYEQHEELLFGTLEKLHHAGLVRSSPSLTTRRQLLASTAKIVAASVVAFVALPAPAAAASSCVPVMGCLSAFPTSSHACSAPAGVACCPPGPAMVCGYLLNYVCISTSFYSRQCVSSTAPLCGPGFQPPGTECQCR